MVDEVVPEKENNPNMVENVKKGIDLGEWANTTKK